MLAIVTAMVLGGPTAIQKALTAQDLPKVIRLVKAGADPNAVVPFNGTLRLTPLVLAAREGNAEAIKLFVSKGANPNLAATQDWSPLGSACFDYHTEAAEALVLAGAHVNLKNTVLSPLLAAVNGLGEHDNGPRDPKRWELIRFLVEHGADVNYRRDVGEPPLFATMDGHSPNQIDVAKYLLGHGARLEDQYPYIGTLLHRAAESQDAETVESVLAFGAKMDARNESGKTPIFYAVTENKAEVRNLLLKHGASLSDGDNLGETPIFAAVRQVEAERVQWCIDHGADLKAKNNRGQTPLALLDSFLEEGISTSWDGQFTKTRYQAVRQALTKAKTHS